MGREEESAAPGTETGRTRCMGSATAAVGTYGKREEISRRGSLKEAWLSRSHRTFLGEAKSAKLEDKGWKPVCEERQKQG